MAKEKSLQDMSIAEIAAYVEERKAKEKDSIKQQIKELEKKKADTIKQIDKEIAALQEQYGLSTKTKLKAKKVSGKGGARGEVKGKVIAALESGEKNSKELQIATGLTGAQVSQCLASLEKAGLLSWKGEPKHYVYSLKKKK